MTTLTAILLLWKVSNRHILETLASTEKLFPGLYFFILKVFKIFKSQSYLASHMIRTEKGLKLNVTVYNCRSDFSKCLFFMLFGLDKILMYYIYMMSDLTLALK